MTHKHQRTIELVTLPDISCKLLRNFLCVSQAAPRMTSRAVSAVSALLTDRIRQPIITS